MEVCATVVMWIELDKCVLCVCVLCPTSSVYLVELGYICGITRSHNCNLTNLFVV